MRLFENVRKTLTATSLLGMSGTLLMGVVSITVMTVGGQMIVQGGMTMGEFIAYTLYLGLLVAPVFQIVGIGSQVTEAFAGLGRMQGVLAEAPADGGPARVHRLDAR